MNYRHAFHAGNFADVVKHTVLALVIERLKLKGNAIRVVDTHAGIGSYDLAATAALKTGEWRAGIGRLIGPDAAPLPPPIAALLAPYLDVVTGLNPPGQLARYPGSPAIARALLRPHDRLVANELHPEDAETLRLACAGDDRVKVMELDGWTALKALLPPKERRGVVLIDPPFEVRGEFDRLVEALQQGIRRFSTGIYLLWYPIKDRAAVARFKRTLAATGIPRLVAVELLVGGDIPEAGLAGSGLMIHNLPYQLDEVLTEVLPVLAQRLALEPGGGRWALDVLAGEKPDTRSD